MKKGSLDIFEYDDPGVFLRDAYNELKTKEPGISHRYISSKLGVKSSAVFCQILTGRINPTRDKIHIIAKIFSLDENERDYISLLFQIRKIQELNIVNSLKDYLTRKRTNQIKEKSV